MEKYKRFSKELFSDADIQKFLDELTMDGWKIIHYNEQPIGGMGILKIIVVCKKTITNEKFIYE